MPERKELRSHESAKVIAVKSWNIKKKEMTKVVEPILAQIVDLVIQFNQYNTLSASPSTDVSKETHDAEAAQTISPHSDVTACARGKVTTRLRLPRPEPA